MVFLLFPMSVDGARRFWRSEMDDDTGRQRASLELNAQHFRRPGRGGVED
jgi:hypothetical protein